MGSHPDRRCMAIIHGAGLRCTSRWTALRLICTLPASVAHGICFEIAPVLYMRNLETFSNWKRRVRKGP
jgi:predicted membrane protein